MSQIQQALHNEVQALSLIRDEMKLQAHLFHAEARDSWQEMETRWDDLKVHVARAKIAAADAAPQIQTAAQLMIDTLKTSYADFKSALKH